MEDRANIAAAITAELESTGQEATPPAPEVTPATAQATEPVKVQDDAPAAAAPEAPSTTSTPIALKDTDRVVDPADGAEKTWAEVKAERLRHADYTRKTMELAEARRAWEAEKIAAQTAAVVEKARASRAKLPDDDPYAQNINALDEQFQAMLAAQQAQQKFIEEQQVAAARARLDADEARAADQYKLGERDRSIVGQELLRRMSAGDPTASYDVVAREYHEWREAEKAAVREETLREFKEKHRVGAPAASAAAPAPGVATELPRPGTRAMLDAMVEEVAAMMR